MHSTAPKVADVEKHNLAEIERLNQRGGRTLSSVDLVEAGTLTVEMVAFCRVMMLHGAGLLTGAVPGGAGKTTLMAALLGFLPSGEPIVPVGDRHVLEAALAGRLTPPVTLMAHELGAGRWYGYVWGRDVADFFRLAGGGVRCVSCLHSDDPRQTQEALAAQGVAPGDLTRVGLEVYLHVSGGRAHAVRRVSGLHCRLDGRLCCAYCWRPADDVHEALVPRDELVDLVAREYRLDAADVAHEWAAGEREVERLLRAGVRDFGEVRRAVQRLT